MSSIVRMIPLSAITFPSSTRSFDKQHARRIAESIPRDGDILQPIGVIAEGDGFRGIWGRHRFGAYALLGRKQIPARVLPPNTTAADELRYSMMENNLRRDESFEDTLSRVELLAEQLDCSETKAARLANVKPAYVSRCKAVRDKLSPAAKTYADQHKLGISDQYLVATKATSPEMQLKAFKSRVAGTSRDDLAAWFKEHSSNRPKAKKTKIVLTIDDSEARLIIPEDMDYERLDQLLKSLRKKLFENKNVAPRLLPEVLR